MEQADWCLTGTSQTELKMLQPSLESGKPDKDISHGRGQLDSFREWLQKGFIGWLQKRHIEQRTCRPFTDRLLGTLSSLCRLLHLCSISLHTCIELQPLIDFQTSKNFCRDLTVTPTSGPAPDIASYCCGLLRCSLYSPTCDCLMLPS